MRGFSSVDELRRIFGGFFAAIQGNDNSKLFAGSGIVVGYYVSDLDTTVVLDGSIPPVPGKMFGIHIGDPQAPEPVVTFVLTSELLDGVYRGEVQPLAALSSGKITSRGNAAIGLRLLPAVARLIPFYKEYRAAHENTSG